MQSDQDDPPTIGDLPQVDVVSFVDEAGLSGLLRNLTSARDQEVAVMCALPVPTEHVDLLRARMRPLFDTFCSAAPENAKLHITAAFESGREDWRVVAEAVREDIFAVMREIGLRVVYAARRGRLAREHHERLAQFKDATPSSGSNPRSNYAVPGQNRPSDEIVLEQVIVDLALQMDAFMEVAEKNRSDFHFDQIDRSLAERYTRMIERTRNISFHRHEVKARNLATGKDEVRVIEMRVQAGASLDTTHVGKIVVAGKTDPLVFAADVVANSLWRHLKRLPADAPLHAQSSLVGWPLEPITFYDRRPDAPPSMFDKF